MAIISCPECGKQVSDKATACPVCGYPLNSTSQSNGAEDDDNKRISKRNKRIAIITTPIVCAVIAFIIVLNAVIIPNGKYKVEKLKVANVGGYVYFGTYEQDDNTSNGKATCWWWLRSPGDSQDHAASVYYDGDVFGRGLDVRYVNVAVRPALWINIE